MNGLELLKDLRRYSDVPALIWMVLPLTEYQISIAATKQVADVI
jgi:hypothetical protein